MSLLFAVIDQAVNVATYDVWTCPPPCGEMKLPTSTKLRSNYH